MNITDGNTFSPEETIEFHVAMEITHRYGATLEVDFGDGHRYMANLEDTNTSTMALQCQHGDMYVSASYGEGCRLNLQFEHSYEVEGVFLPAVTVQSENLTVEQILGGDIIILNQLHSAKIQSDKDVLVNTTTLFIVHLATSSLNMTYYWTVSDEQLNVMDNLTTSLGQLPYSFNTEGIYHVNVRVSNRISHVNTLATATVVDGITQLEINCITDNVYLATEDILNCQATSIATTHTNYKWETRPPFTMIKTSSHGDGSEASISFQRPSRFNISVTAFNAKSKSVAYLSHEIIIQDPVQHVSIQAINVNVAGRPDTLRVKYRGDSVDVFKVNYGRGYHTLEEVDKYQSYPGEFEIEHTFYERGVHRVEITACNKVSCMNDSTVALVQEHMPSMSLKVVNPVLVNKHTIIYANCESKPF